MPKEFYTERDIEDMVKRGISSLTVNDNIVLTDLAYEKANRLGLRLIQDKPANPPAAPVRPYISATPKPPVAVPPASTESSSLGVPTPLADGTELHQRIKNAVIARLGSQVDSNLLDVIIQRVLAQTGLK